MADCICPVIKETDWDEQEHRWAERFFYQQPLCYFFGMPIRAGSMVQQLWRTLEARHYTLTDPVQVLFSEAHFRGAILVGIDRPADDSRFSITCFKEAYWYSVVHHGSLGQARVRARQLKRDLNAGGKRIHQLYYWCVTCPQCRAERGGDRIILLARIK